MSAELEPHGGVSCSAPYRRLEAGLEHGRTNLTTDCAAVRERGWEYLDAELDTEEMAGIGRHVVLCLGCRQAVAFDRAFLELLRRQRALPAPGPFVWRVKVSLRSLRQ